ncbi:MAG TPA: NusG domain II-containing protein [bacterium]|nr:NusG domain II-containing protein [bacterium]
MNRKNTIADFHTRSRRFPGVRPGDVLIFAGLSAAFFLSLILVRLHHSPGSHALVFQENRLQYRVPLNIDNRIEVRGPSGSSVIRIQNGQVWVEEAPCPHRVCMRMGRISLSGEVIVCVPNRLLIRIENGRNKLDAVTQ